MMELELGLALPDPGGPKAKKATGELGVGFDGKAAFGAGKATLLPLFVRGNDGGDGGDEHRDGDDCKRTNKRKRLVGWPPVKSAHHHRRGSSGGYVKVKMEGVTIGRKVDVTLQGSYDDLRRTLDRMFPTSSAAAGTTTEDDVAGGRRDHHQLGHHRRHPYVVTYEDGEGDWLLVGDVPWEVFVKSVKRLKIYSRD